MTLLFCYYEFGGEPYYECSRNLSKIRRCNSFISKTERKYSSRTGPKKGVNEVQIRRYELNNATPRRNQLQKIAEALDINIYELYTTAINNENGDTVSTMDCLGVQLDEGLDGLLKFLSMHGIEYSISEGAFIFEETGQRYIITSENFMLFFDAALEQLKFLIRLLFKESKL